MIQYGDEISYKVNSTEVNQTEEIWNVMDGD